MSRHPALPAGGKGSQGSATTGSSVSSESFDRLILEASAVVDKTPHLKMPWETGVMAHIFSRHESENIFKVPEIFADEGSVSSAQDFEQALGSVAIPVDGHVVYDQISLKGLRSKTVLTEEACPTLRIGACSQL